MNMSSRYLLLVAFLFSGCGKNPPAQAQEAPQQIVLLPAKEIPEQDPVEPGSDLSVALALNRTMADTVEQVLPTVVVIRTESTQYYVDWYGRLLREAQRPVGQGSGVIIHEQGYVLTNNHVLQGGERIEVVMQDEQVYEAELVGRNVQTDIAVLKLKTEEEMSFPAIQAGDSDRIRVGEMVLAIGSPFSLSSTVTQGVISQKGRSEANLPIVDFIQTSAAINPGNSGGPLVDLHGRLIGINTMIRTGGPNNVGSIGIGFAVPSNLALKVAELLISGAEPEDLPFLGVVMRDTRSGVLLTRIVDESPAAEAGLKDGDIIRAINGRRIRYSGDLASFVRLSDPGDTLEVEILRDEKTILLSVMPRLMRPEAE